MKKLLLALCIIALWCSPLFAASSNQVSCGNTATLLYQPQGYFVAHLIIKNQSASTVTVYIAPRADITTSNAGADLPPGAGFIFDGNSNTWYCITSSGSATVGWTEAQ